VQQFSRLRHAGSDQADHQSQVIEDLDSLGGSGDQGHGGSRGQRLDDQVFALPEVAEPGKFGGVDFLSKGPKFG
jgi:hypothetical protein